MRWAREPAGDETRKRLLAELENRQVSKTLKHASSAGPEETTTNHQLCTTASEYGCASGDRQYSAAKIITGSNDKTDRASGVDQWQRELGHGALNLVSVAHSS